MTSGESPPVDPMTPRRGWRGALSFLTPLGGPVVPAPQAASWFPAVGAVIGLAVGALWWAAAKQWPGPVAATLVVGADLGLTGMLHFDGLLDSADGLLAHLDRQRRLEVMSMPGVGAFAVAVGGVVLLARWGAIASLRPAPFLLAGLWCASRTLMAAVMRNVPYAHQGDGGLASAFLGGPNLWALAAGAVGALGLAAWWRPVVGPASVVAGVAAGLLVVWQGVRKLGGFTGDVLGAAGVVAETAGLIVASARW